jgi:hypothetical protein
VKPVQTIIPGDRRDIALPPAPIVDKWLVDSDKTDGHSHKTDSKSDFERPVVRRKHDSRLDKATQQSQSSTNRLRDKTRRPR